MRRNFNLIRQQMKNFPIDPQIVKNFTMGVYGEIPYPLSDLNEILHQSDLMIEVSMSDRARSKNNIAENLFALGHETHNS